MDFCLYKMQLSCDIIKYNIVSLDFTHLYFKRGMHLEQTCNSVGRYISIFNSIQQYSICPNYLLLSFLVKETHFGLAFLGTSLQSHPMNFKCINRSVKIKIKKHQYFLILFPVSYTGVSILISIGGVIKTQIVYKVPPCGIKHTEDTIIKPL